MVVSAAVVDTDLFSHVYLRGGSKDDRLAVWRDYLAGRRVVISFQTRAEVIAGAWSANWAIEMPLTWFWLVSSHD